MTSSQSARRPSAVRVLQTQGHLGKVEQASVIRRDAASVQRVSTAHTRASILGLEDHGGLIGESEDWRYQYKPFY